MLLKLIEKIFVKPNLIFANPRYLEIVSQLEKLNAFVLVFVHCQFYCQLYYIYDCVPVHEQQRKQITVRYRLLAPAGDVQGSFLATSMKKDIGKIIAFKKFIFSGLE